MFQHQQERAMVSEEVDVEVVVMLGMVAVMLDIVAVMLGTVAVMLALVVIVVMEAPGSNEGTTGNRNTQCPNCSAKPPTYSESFHHPVMEHQLSHSSNHGESPPYSPPSSPDS